jgi:polysaccharide deacetylase family protein (PEP-CTERM system associated)
MNIITIDVEDWYNSSLDLFKDSPVKHGSRPDESVLKNTRKTLELLRDTGNRGTFFVLGTVAEHFPELVREILSGGHEIATHGYSHRLVYNMTPTEFEDDLKLSLDHLHKAGAADIIGYRAPYWSITRRSLWALNVLARLGFKYDSSIFPIRRGLYGVPDAVTFQHRILGDLWEFPPMTFRFLGTNWPIAGGGYLRLVPYRLIRYAINKSTSQTARVFYFHPYELDPEDVHLRHRSISPATLLYWAQQITGRKRNPQKLKDLLSEFKFVTIRETLEKMNGEEHP